MLRDAGPGLICCGDAALRDAICGRLAGCAAIRVVRRNLQRQSAERGGRVLPCPPHLLPHDTVAILYTSGTSGEAKGVMLTVGNLDHMLSLHQRRASIN